jgi:hypothetical protein
MWLKNLKNEETMARVGPQLHKKKSYFWIANWKKKDPAPNGSKHSLSSFCS